MAKPAIFVNRHPWIVVIVAHELPLLMPTKELEPLNRKSSREIGVKWTDWWLIWLRRSWDPLNWASAHENRGRSWDPTPFLRQHVFFSTERQTWPWRCQRGELFGLDPRVNQLPIIPIWETQKNGSSSSFCGKCLGMSLPEVDII